MRSNVVRHKRSCGRKKKFKDRSYAEAIASKYPGVVVYQCLCCGLFHTGRPSERNKREPPTDTSTPGRTATP